MSSYSSAEYMLLTISNMYEGLWRLRQQGLQCLRTGCYSLGGNMGGKKIPEMENTIIEFKQILRRERHLSECISNVQ